MRGVLKLFALLALAAPAARAEPLGGDAVVLDPWTVPQSSPGARWSPPLVAMIVDPWREPRMPSTPALERRSELDQIVDPWAKLRAPQPPKPALRQDFALTEIVDPWAEPRPRVPTAAFAPLERRAQ